MKLPEPDATHSPKLKSWVESANVPGCEFPIQNLPFGMFRPKGARKPPRPGVAIGDRILDLAAISPHQDLNELAAKGRSTWKALRRELSRALSPIRSRPKRCASACTR